MPNEIEKFLEDTNTDPMKVDILEAPLTPEAPAAESEGESEATTEESGELKPRNRRERRLMEKLAAERESSSFLAGKLEARTEAREALTEEADYLKSIERIYGTDTPEAQLATDLLKKAIVGAREDAKAQAVAELREERLQEAEEFQAAESELDNMVDEIEEEYGITLTAPQETAFFNLLAKMSPKDQEGQVREYADPHAVWEVFQERLKGRSSSETNRAKDMSSRSMTQSGASKESNLNNDVTARFLSEQGII